MTWKILCQENIEILPGQSVLISLSFGVEMSEGATMVSLDESLKRLKCGLQNEIVLESTSDTVNPRLEAHIENLFLYTALSTYV